MTQPARIPSTYSGEAAWCRSVMATLRSRPVTGMRGGSWVSNPRRTRATRVRRRRCNGVGAPRGASGPLTTGMCEHDLAGCHRALGCLGQGGVGGILRCRHSWERMRSPTYSLNPLARTYVFARVCTRLGFIARDSAARPCAPVEVGTFPSRLRFCNVHAPPLRPTMATGVARPRELSAIPIPVQPPFRKFFEHIAIRYRKPTATYGSQARTTYNPRTSQ